VELGVQGYLNKTDDSNQLRYCLDRVVRGETYFNNYAKRIIIENIDRMNDLPSFAMSKQQFSIAWALSDGLTTQQICRANNLSEPMFYAIKNEIYHLSQSKDSGHLVGFLYRNFIRPQAEKPDGRSAVGLATFLEPAITGNRI
jgi:DNA-binding NarL/FixJ family response regulator